MTGIAPAATSVAEFCKNSLLVERAIGGFIHSSAVLHSAPKKPYLNSVIIPVLHQETALRSAGKGNYRVRLRNNITTHMDFSDLPVLGARDRVYAERRAAILAVLRNYTLAFFDKYLKGDTKTILDIGEPIDSRARLEKFPSH